MRIGELFSGYGGLGMGVQSVLGGDIVWHSDIDRGACKILTHRYPDVPNLGDITCVDWSQVEPVDVLTGGSPCQDLSHAGKRGGMSEGTRSNLWVAMREAIAQLRPGVVVWENVEGAASAGADSELESRPGLLDSVRRRDGEPVLRALGRVVGDLSSLGYVGRVGTLRAADVGAPHGRRRRFLIATDARGIRGAQALEHDGRRAAVGDRASVPDQSDRHALRPGPDRVRLLLKTPTSQLAVNGGSQHPDKRRLGGHGPTLADEIEHLLPTPSAMAPDAKVSDRARELYSSTDRLGDVVERSIWGDYAACIARWETVLGRPAPAPTMTSAKGNPQLSPRFVEWMQGLPAGWVTDVPGITRNEALRALGNGVVPAQCAAALRLMLNQERAA